MSHRTACLTLAFCKIIYGQQDVSYDLGQTVCGSTQAWLATAQASSRVVGLLSFLHVSHH